MGIGAGDAADWGRFSCGGEAVKHSSSGIRGGCCVKDPFPNLNKSD